MHLYIIRHADAESRDGWTACDAERPLTPLGHRQARELGEAFRQRGISFDAVLTSPMIRAKQTAEGILGTAANGSGPQLCDLLAQDELRRRKLTKVLAETDGESVAIVGHEPDLASYLAWLLGTDAANLHIEKGAVALVRFEDEPAKGDGELVWVITPDWYLTPQPQATAV